MAASFGYKFDTQIGFHATESRLTLKRLIELLAPSEQTNNFTEMNDWPMRANDGLRVDAVGGDSEPITIPIVDRLWK